MAIRETVLEGVVIVGGLVCAVLLAALLVSGCGDTASTSRGQIGAATVICTDEGATTFSGTVQSMIRTRYPWACPPGGVWAVAQQLPPFPMSQPPTAVAIQASEGGWYLVDDRTCTGLPDLPLPSEECPPGMACVRGPALPCAS